MVEGRRRFAGVLLVLVCAAMPAAAEVFGEIQVEPRLFFTSNARHGYQEFRFRVINRSQVRSHRVRLTLLPNSNRWGAPKAEATVKGEIAAGSEAEFRLFAHRSLGYEQLLEVEIDGGTAKDSPMALAGASGYPSGACLLLLSPELPLASIPEVATRRCTPVPADQSVREWSDHWFAYTGFEGVALLEWELAAAPAGVREALAQFVEGGGLLLLLAAHPGTAAQQPPLELHPRWRSVHHSSQLLRIDAGFGALYVTGVASAAELPGDDLDAVFIDLETGFAPWSRIGSGSWAETNFPVSPWGSRKERPEGRLFLLLIAFALGVGPVAMIWLRRKGRPIWVLVIVPLAAVATCGILIASLLLLEGVQLRQRIDTITLLDQGSREAITLGRTGLYAPFPPSRVPYEARTQLEPNLFSNSNTTNAGRATDWSQGQILGAGWLPPRVPLHLMLRRVEARRERLSVEWSASGAAGEVRVVNGLGAAISRLWVLTPDGRLMTSGAIEAGAAAILKPEPEEDPEALPGMPAGEARRWFTGTWMDLPPQLLAQAPGILNPGTYLAELEGAPFVEPTVAARENLQVRSVVYGIFDAASEAAP